MEKLHQMHLQNMHKAFIIFLLSSLYAQSLLGQQKLRGTYYGRHHYFKRDTDTLVTSFDHDGLAAFMIRGKKPFKPEYNRVGFIDTSGLIVIRPDYSNCSYFWGDYALVQGITHERKFGLIDRAGKIIIPIEYTRLERCLNGLFLIGKNGKIGFINIKGQIIVPPEKYSGCASSLSYYQNYSGDCGGCGGHIDGFLNIPFYLNLQFKNYIGVSVGDKWAVIDSTGKEIIPPKFDGIGIFNQTVAVAKMGVKYGVTDTAGNMLIPALYDKIELTNTNLVLASSGKKMGLLSLDNKLLIPIIHDNLKQIANDAFLFYDNGKCGVIDIKNRTIIPLTNYMINPFKKGYVLSDQRYYQALYDADGNCLSGFLPNVSNSIYYWGNNEAGFFIYNYEEKKFHRYQKMIEYRKMFDNQHQLFYYSNEKWGMIDTTGKEITPPLFDKINYEELDALQNFNDAPIAVKKNNKWGIISKKGKMLSGFEYDSLFVAGPHNYYPANILIARQGTKFGFFNKAIVTQTPVKYDSLLTTPDWGEPNSKGPRIAINCRIGKKWGLLDTNGREITPIKYDSVFYFNHHLAIVQVKGKYGVINNTGYELIKCVYDNINFSIAPPPSGYFHHQFITKKNNLFGLIDSTGKTLSPPVYEKLAPVLYPFFTDYMVVYKGKMGLMNKYGKIIIPCIYQGISFKYYIPPFVMVRKGGYYGLMDVKGHVKTGLIYDEIGLDGDENYKVRRNGKLGLLNKNGDVMIAPAYDDISLHYLDDAHIVTLDGKKGILDKKGIRIVDLVYTDIIPYSTDVIVVERDGKYGLVNSKGAVIFPCIYHNITVRDGKIVRED